MGIRAVGFVLLVLRDVRGTPACSKGWGLGGDEGVDDVLGSGNAVVLVGGVLLVHGEAGAGAAVGFDEDSVAEDHGAVAGAVGLGGADVAGGCVAVAVVDGDVVVDAFGYGSTVGLVSACHDIHRVDGGGYTMSGVVSARM